MRPQSQEYDRQRLDTLKPQGHAWILEEDGNYSMELLQAHDEEWHRACLIGIDWGRVVLEDGGGGATGSSDHLHCFE